MPSHKKISQSTVYHGWRNMLSKTFRLPDGQTADFDVVQNGDFVTIAAFTKNKEAILVRQFRPGPELELWSFPEGYIDDQETPADAAARELLEETGFRAGQLLFQKTFRQAYNTERRHSFLAIDCQQVAAPRFDEKEFIHIELVPLAALKRMLTDTADETLMNVDSAYMALAKMGWL